MKNICICFFFLLVCCDNSKNRPLKCVTEYVLTQLEDEEVTMFKQLEGLEIWREWGGLTADFAEEYQILRDCEIEKYIEANGFKAITLEGRMFLVYSIHSQVKYGYVNPNSIRQQIEQLTEDD